MWAQVERSTVGERITRSADGTDVLVGQQVTLQLLLWTPTSAGYRVSPTRESLTWTKAFEPHVAAVLAPGAWLEIAYDPAGRAFWPQQLVTRDGAVLTTLPV